MSQSFSPQLPCFRTTTVLLALILGGCAIHPSPMSIDDHRQVAMRDRNVASSEVEPLTTKLTLAEALARGLKYNLNHRTRMMEQALAVGQLDLSRYDMLPKLTAAAGYDWRSKDRITRSKDSVTGLPSLANPFISSARDHSTADLGLTWNLLDFGVSYQNAKQNADRVLVAAEHRRKAMHLLMQDICTVYWRALSAQKIDRELRETIQLGEAALGNSQKVENEKVRDPLEALRYQRTILENLRILESIKRELATAHIELAALINLPLGTRFELAEPSEGAMSPSHIDLNIEQMEELAIANNADLKSEFYNARIAVSETKKSILKLLPGISLNYSYRHDSDNYLINNDWKEAGAQISWNLFNILSMPATMRYSKANENLAEQRRIAMQMAVLAQVHLSRQQYDHAYRIFKRADAIWRVDRRIYDHTVNRESANVKSQLDRVLNGTSAVVSLLRRFQALSDVYAASSTVRATLGVEPAIGDLQSTPLHALTNTIEASLYQEHWDTPVSVRQMATNSKVKPTTAAIPAKPIVATTIKPTPIVTPAKPIVATTIKPTTNLIPAKPVVATTIKPTPIVTPAKPIIATTIKPAPIVTPAKPIVATTIKPAPIVAPAKPAVAPTIKSANVVTPPKPAIAATVKSTVQVKENLPSWATEGNPEDDKQDPREDEKVLQKSSPTAKLPSWATDELIDENTGNQKQGAHK